MLDQAERGRRATPVIAPLTTSIQSLDDPRVAHYRYIGDSAYLSAHQLFVAEGRLVVRRLLESRTWRTASVLVTEAAHDSLASIVADAPSRPPIYVLDQADMSGLVGFNIHRGCLALAVRPASRVFSPGDTAHASRVLVLEGVNNPDNVGGIFRSAEAFGVDVVILGPRCGDPLYRKAVRTSMAATLSVPFVDAGAWPDALAILRGAGFTVIALTPDAGALPLVAIERGPYPIALLVGAEGDGLTSPALKAASMRVRIPMTAAVDSLNVTSAASIAMYHVFGELEAGR